MRMTDDMINSFAERTHLSLRSLTAVCATPMFLGIAPIFGKLALNAGADSFSVAAVRTILAVGILWLLYYLFFRQYIFIYPAGLLGCVVIGAINGIGSLFYYGGLGVLDAGLAQLLYGMYLPFAVLISHLGGQRADKRTLIRVALAMLALLLITGFSAQPTNLTGVGLMLGSALMFAGTLILGQYVLFEMPAPTMTLYTLTTMGIVVTMFWLAAGEHLSATVWVDTLPWLFALAVSTALSRLAMYAGVKFMGGMQTAILAAAEIGVSLLLAVLVLHETLTPLQWVGVGVLAFGILLIRQQDFLPHGYNPAALVAANLPSVQFQRIAFYHAFGTDATDNEQGTMASITTQEIIAIQRMMGAQTGAIDPYPIGKGNLFQAPLNEAEETPITE